jgi:hypothetical protein
VTPSGAAVHPGFLPLIPGRAFRAAALNFETAMRNKKKRLTLATSIGESACRQAEDVCDLLLGFLDVVGQRFHCGWSVDVIEISRRGVSEQRYASLEELSARSTSVRI